MLRNYLIIAITLGIGALIGYTLLPGPAVKQTSVDRRDYPSTPVLNRVPAQPVDAQELASMREQLQQAREEREQLMARLDRLQKTVETFQHQNPQATMITTETETNLPAETQPVVRSSVQALIEAGIGEEQAAWLQERLDEMELEQLYLRDRATREGWINKPRYYKERQQIQNTLTELRDEVDGDVYDRLLYTLGRANRVLIKDTMQYSVAAQYGLQNGDRIMEYDGQRIFNTNELSSMVTQGRAGEMTLVRVEREGEMHDIYLPRGPLGIRMSAARLAP